jgi:oxalate decarboxylase/phosphoglucose isomerase-like protein (cupin superfamily)
MFKSDHFADVSLTNWLALTPPELVKAHLGLSDETLAVIRKGAVKPVIVGPNPAVREA